MKVQKRLAAQILKCSEKRVKLDSASSEDIKKSITKTDIRNLIKTGAIKKIPKKGVSRSRAKKTQSQKRKGRQKGQGSRKGKSTARTPKKAEWIKRARTQRGFLKRLKEKELISNKIFKDIYLKIKGGFFRNKRHLKLFMEEKQLIKKKN